MTLEQALYKNTETKHLAEIERLREYVDELLSVHDELRAMKNALDRSNLQLASENKRLREIVRSFTESTEKRHYSQTRDTEEPPCTS